MKKKMKVNRKEYTNIESNSAKTKSIEAEKIIVTAALPYANGSIHIGHLLEYVQADIYVRFLKLLGKDALYICASDMHGTPIEINAKKAGKKPEQFVEEYWREHQQDFASFLICFDNYYKTHSPENKELAEFFYSELKKKGLIYLKPIKVIYCENCQRSLPDRFVKGTCPHCKAEDQYGDVCEKCSTVLKGVDLINPFCTICRKKPILKEKTHYFFKLSHFSHQLETWMNSKEADLQVEVRNWLQEWINKGLEDWCVSRDAPYFGFEIPNSKQEAGETKYFYVWLDAPIGYISSTKNYCDKHNLKWEDYWYKGQVYHIIGKDIAYFHFLFWPAMLMGVGLPLPKLTVHGFVTVNGEKMSKSRGTFFTAKDFAKLYPAEALRFYYANHLDRKVVDVDLNLKDFQALNNNVLMGNLGNFCYRVLTFAEKNYGEIKEVAPEKELTLKAMNLLAQAKESYTRQDFHLAIKEILMVADLGNSYFQNSEPWKDPAAKKEVVGWCVNLARNLAIVVQPILPHFSRLVFHSLGEKGEKEENSKKSEKEKSGKDIPWKDINFNWQGKLSKPEMLVAKIESIQEQKTFPVRMVVGEIKEVKAHPNADSLYVFKVDFGDLGMKPVVAGLKKYFPVAELLGKKVVFCVNLKPAKLRGEMSEAMTLAAEDEDHKVALLEAGKMSSGMEVQFGKLSNSRDEISFEDFGKVRMEIKGGKVYCEGALLADPVGSKEEVLVKGVKDGATVR